MAFAWVAVLAGYSGTPAEEMEGVRTKGQKAVVFPFGKHKDAEPSTLPLEDLHKELGFWEKKTAEEQNPRFKANNEKLVNAIKSAIAEKTAKPETPEAPRDTPMEPVPPKTLQSVDHWRLAYDACQTPGEYQSVEDVLRPIWAMYAGEERTAIKIIRDKTKVRVSEA